jgi:hypothetical protein
MGNSMVPWGRVGLPDDVGYLAAYLMSDASEFMTGHILYFDGGLTAKMAIDYNPHSTSSIQETHKNILFSLKTYGFCQVFLSPNG